MPVVLEQGASGRSFNLLEGVRCVPVFPRDDEAIEIGIVNNMPDSALELTERQFIGLLAAASGKTQVRVQAIRIAAGPARAISPAGASSPTMRRSAGCGTRSSMPSSSPEWNRAPRR